MSDVALGSWTVDELRASGFDEVGVVQPLLRPREEPLPQAEALRRDLEARGELVLQDGRWTPRGDLGVVLVTRARARLLVGVRDRTTLLLGRFAPGGALLQVDVDGGDCACRLRTRDAVLDDLLAGVLDRVPDAGSAPDAELQEPPLLVLEALRADDPALPPVQVRLSVLAGADGARLLWGRRRGEQEELSAQAASHRGVQAAVRAVLGGEAG